VAGSAVTIAVKKGGKTGAKKSVTLLRMPSEAIADRRRLFELFTAMKARATLPRGRETIEGMIDNAIDLWTRMTIADSERDAKIRTKVTHTQDSAKLYFADLAEIAENKKALYFERHDDTLGFREHFQDLYDCVKATSVENARLTLALKEAEGEIIDLRAECVKSKDAHDKDAAALKAANADLETKLRLALEAMEKLKQEHEKALDEFGELRKRGMGDSEEIEKLKVCIYVCMYVRVCVCVCMYAIQLIFEKNSNPIFHTHFIFHMGDSEEIEKLKVCVYICMYVCMLCVYAI
jgi:hypothetical protein